MEDGLCGARNRSVEKYFNSLIWGSWTLWSASTTYVFHCISDDSLNVLRSYSVHSLIIFIASVSGIHFPSHLIIVILQHSLRCRFSFFDMNKVVILLSAIVQIRH
jgi:Trk-type K+ transport system membrane component